MFAKNRSITKPEVLQSHHDHALCWRSAIGGLFVALFTFVLLSAFGTGILGVAARSAVETESGGSALANGSALWIGLSMAISLFTGTYFAVRLSNKLNRNVAFAHGFVVTSLFFALLLSGVGSAVGSFSKGFGGLIVKAGEGSADLLSNPIIQDAINKALPTQNIKSEAKAVAQGIALRLMQGNYESVKSYITYETGMSGTELDEKVTQLKTDFQAAAKEAGEKAAKGVAAVGFAFFVMFLGGLLGSMVGGRIAIYTNSKQPLIVRTQDSFVRESIFEPSFRQERGAPMNV